MDPGPITRKRGNNVKWRVVRSKSEAVSTVEDMIEEDEIAEHLIIGIDLKRFVSDSATGASVTVATTGGPLRLWEISEGGTYMEARSEVLLMSCYIPKPRAKSQLRRP